MKRIINSKKYDTKTAKEVGANWNGYPDNDFCFLNEVLYRKDNGEFFLYGEGGPMSKYSKSCGDSRGYGEHIEPMSEEQARAWAEENLNGDEYEAIFGEVEE